jgi:hypothetical protein
LARPYHTDHEHSDLADLLDGSHHISVDAADPALCQAPDDARDDEDRRSGRKDEGAERDAPDDHANDESDVDV